MEHRRDLDGVRGVACLSVILLHTVVGAIQAEAGSSYDQFRIAIQPFLIGGVDLFFVLSGFLIGGILLDNKESTNYFRTFWRRRIGRIFPVYYVMILVLIALYAVDWFYKTPLISGLLYNQLPVWAYATFIQNFYMVSEGVFGNFLGVTWSLAVEEQFYLILPPLVFLLSRGKIVVIAVLAIFAAPFVRTILWQNIDWQASYLLSPARMDTVMWGVLIACAVRNEHVISVLSRLRMAIGIIIVFLAALVAADMFNYASAPLLATTTYHTHGLFVSTLRYSALAMMYALIILRLYLPGAGALRSFFVQPNSGPGRPGFLCSIHVPPAHKLHDPQSCARWKSTHRRVARCIPADYCPQPDVSCGCRFVLLSREADPRSGETPEIYV